MKTIKIIVLLIIAGGYSCKKQKGNIPCIPNNLENKVIAFYPFSNGSLNDVSGNNNHLINMNSANASSDRNGNTTCAYEFSNMLNQNQFLTTASTSVLNDLNKFSISLWYLPQDTSRAGGDLETLISRDSIRACPDRSGQWSISLYDCRKAVFGRTNSVWDKNISTNFSCEAEVITRTDTWAHVVATYNRNGSSMKIYRNGVLQESSSGHANCSNVISSYQDIGDLYLGKNFTGKLDDIIIFNKELSQSNIDDLYNMSGCCE